MVQTARPWRESLVPVRGCRGPNKRSTWPNHVGRRIQKEEDAADFGAGRTLHLEA